jgi:hypothetical protein
MRTPMMTATAVVIAMAAFGPVVAQSAPRDPLGIALSLDPPTFTPL